MMFDGRHLDEISDDEIIRLVTEHASERGTLEFKMTVKTGDDEQRIELLRDVTSLANASGGYIVVGIRDDGKGRAQKFEPQLVGDVEKIRSSIMSLCLDHVVERIEGLECEARVVDGNPVVIVRVPRSDRRPHMVTYNKRTDFFTRHHDGKRAMTLGEVREAFHGETILKRISDLGDALRSLTTQRQQDATRERVLEAVRTGSTVSPARIEDGALALELAEESLSGRISDAPTFWMAATPSRPRAGTVDVDSATLSALLSNPPGSRENGWSLDMATARPERVSTGVVVGRADFRQLTVLDTGHCELEVPLDEHFCWRQDPAEFAKRPRLYPIPVVEYPVSFLRFVRALVDQFKIGDDFLIRLSMRNARGYVLPPGAPDTIGFSVAMSIRQPKPFGEQHVLIGPRRVTSDFTPDVVAYAMLKEVYGAFGHSPTAIPYFRPDSNEFRFP